MICFDFSFISLIAAENFPFIGVVSSLFRRGKSQRLPRHDYDFVFWPKTLAQASMCELVRYHDAKSMIARF